MKKLLIIDDEFIFRQGLRYMMDWEACGYTIAGEASNGQEGLELCRTLKPDLVLCDVVMPVLSGVEFVRELKLLGGPSVVMLSNFDEYDKVRKAFQYGASDYLLKSQITQESLLSCLERIVSTHDISVSNQPEKTFGVLIRQVLDGYSQEPYEDLGNYLAHRLSARGYLLLFIDSPQPDFKSEAHLDDSLRQFLPGQKVCTAFTTQNHAVCLIGLEQEHAPVWLHSFLEQLGGRILHTSCVLSLPFTDISTVRQKAETLYELCGYSILYENKLCFYEPETQREENSSPAFLSERYFSYVQTGRLEEACRLLLSYLDSLKNTCLADPYQLRKFVEHTFYDTLRELRRTAENPQLLNRIELKLFKQLDSAITFIQLRDALAGAYGELACACDALHQDDPVIHHMMDYLEENYSRQITLYDVAAHLHMNYSYLSAFISQNTGRHFSEHLNETRIRHAKKLLAETDHSMSYISEATGYADQSYFGKMFKKAVGMTPLQYRNHADRNHADRK